MVLVRNQLQAKYTDIAGRIIAMALESVDYSEEKAMKILEIVMQDDKVIKTETHEVKEDAIVENDAALTKSERYLPDIILNYINFELFHHYHVL